ncbi:hypothetical protein B0T09DRAFT_407930 [Sordaria sp. MPI-SDFR-AT-0083]|nr:hypothetical protein B0T09DRAFT_407930 [Sordaria sp. MPI-SDFR-AT-0083]
MLFSNNTDVFPILRLPAEIRFMICRESCAHLADPEHEDPDNDEIKDNNSDSCIDDDVYESDSEDLDLTNDQLQMVTTLRNLANSCHQIRDELTGEFFTRILSKTQVHLGDVYPARRGPRRRFPAPRHKVSRLSLINRKISDVLRSSSLLAKCENLKTLEVVITRSESALRAVDGDWAPGETVEKEEFCEHCLLKLVSMPKLLEKVSFRMFIDYDNTFIDVTATIDPQLELDLVEYFWGARSTVMVGEEDVTVRKDVVHETKHHMGVVKVDFPLSASV